MCVNAVYIPPDAKDEQKELVISSHMTKQLDAIDIVVGDFNQTHLRPVLPKFHQQVHIPTSEGITNSWQLQSPPQSSFWSIRPYFFACLANLTHQTISKN